MMEETCRSPTLGVQLRPEAAQTKETMALEDGLAVVFRGPVQAQAGVRLWGDCLQGAGSMAGSAKAEAEVRTGEQVAQLT